MLHTFRVLYIKRQIRAAVVYNVSGKSIYNGSCVCFRNNFINFQKNATFISFSLLISVRAKNGRIYRCFTIFVDILHNL